MGQLKTFKIIFNSNQNVFNPGQFIDGKCIIETIEENTYKFLTIKFKGIANVRFKRDDDTLYDSEKYFNYKAIHLENGILNYIFLFNIF